MNLNSALKKLLIPAGALVAAGLSTQSLRLGPWGWIFGAAVALAIWLRPDRSSPPPIPQLELEARLALGGKTQLALVSVEGERYLVVHGERGVFLEKIATPDHTCLASAAPRSTLRTRPGVLRDGWMQ